MERCQKHIKTQCPMPCPVCLIEERDEIQAENINIGKIKIALKEIEKESANITCRDDVTDVYCKDYYKTKLLVIHGFVESALVILNKSKALKDKVVKDG